MRTITLIPGDGIGPEVAAAAMRVVDATGIPIMWERVEAGLPALHTSGNPFPRSVLESIARNRIALKGPLTTPPEFPSVNVALRKHFDLYANIRPVRSFAGVPSRYENVDITLYRENTEEFYVGEERYLSDAQDEAELIARVTRRGSERFLRHAFLCAQERSRCKLTVVHKANIFQKTHGIFLQTARDLAKEFHNVQYEEKIVDNMAMQLVLDPTRFDVIATTNLLGDILSDLCAGLVGGLGLAPGANIGDRDAIFEAVHGSAPDIAGRGIANPCAIILSAALMLRHIGEPDAANRIERAIAQVLKDWTCVTKDINPDRGVSTEEMTSAIVEAMAEKVF